MLDHRPRLDRRLLYRETLAASRAALRTLSSEIASERLYAIGLQTLDIGQSVYLAANTEEALDRAAAKSAERNARSFVSERRILRWSSGDWQYHGSRIEQFAGVQDLLNKGWTTDFSDYHFPPRDLVLIYLSVLRTLRSSDLSYRTESSPSPMLLLLTGDQSDESILSFAAILNPRSAVEALLLELETRSNELMARCRRASSVPEDDAQA